MGISGHIVESKGANQSEDLTLTSKLTYATSPQRQRPALAEGSPGKGARGTLNASTFNFIQSIAVSGAKLNHITQRQTWRDRCL